MKTYLPHMANRKHLARKLYRRACKLEKKGAAEYPSEAVVLLRQSAYLGSSKSALKLAEIYLNENIPHQYNPESGVELCMFLADRGSAPACYMLGKHLYRQGAFQEAIKYLSSIAAMDYAPATALLGKMLIKGEGVKQNKQRGVHMLSEAAQSGNIGAQLTLAEAYDQGIFLPQNPERAVFWTKQAALQGDVSAQIQLGTHYLKGRGVDRDLRESYFWMYQAAKQRHPQAQAFVGECLQEGAGARQNKRKGTRFYAAAASLGDHFATTRLGLCYILGRGVRQDKPRGVNLLREAAENGYDYASVYLVLLGRLNFIPVEADEVERRAASLTEAGHAITFDEEPTPFLKRRRNWIQDEYDRIVSCSEDEEPIPGPFDPLLKLCQRVIALVSKSGS